VNLKRVVVWSAVAVACLYVVQSPDHAAEVVRNAGGGLVLVATSLLSFVGSLI
jgi:hypothetical protein